MADTKITEDTPAPLADQPEQNQSADKSSAEETPQNGHSQEQKDSAVKDEKAATEENGSAQNADTPLEEKDADKAPEEKEAEAPAEENDIALEDVKADPELFKKIIKQIEYYFGNYNLPRDKFLSAEVKKDDGWVPLAVMLKFARLHKLTPSAAVIVVAIRAAESTIMEVDESNKKIRRSPSQPLPELSEGLQEEAIKRTIYCKNFPKDGSVTLDILLEFFKDFGEYDSVRMRNYVDRATNAQGFKGSALVVFKTPEQAKKFLETTVKYKKTALTKMWFGEYLEMKKNEVEERLARKQARLNKSADANGEDKAGAQFEELPRGNFLRATGFADKTTREDIKSAVFDMTNDCAFVDFRKGDEQAFIRFSEAGSNKQILAALEGNLKVNGANISLFLVEGEEEEAQLTKANEARRKAHASGPHPKKRKAGGGYGGRGGRGGKNKRQRTK